MLLNDKTFGGLQFDFFFSGDGPSAPPNFLVHHFQQQQQGQGQVSPSTCLSEHLLQTVMALLHSDVAEHGRHLAQYFHLFVMYASLGAQEKQQLLQDLMDYLGFNSLVLQAPARIYGSDGGLSVVHSTSILPMHE